MVTNSFEFIIDANSSKDLVGRTIPSYEDLNQPVNGSEASKTNIRLFPMPEICFIIKLELYNHCKYKSLYPIYRINAFLLS